mmetsp:Transcript_8782/g.37108  ORF Transcript_8782/g.37108 Transcript_8782/m.37108 type:complete len:210 (-) Transcript_8782:33-662(-)
MRDVQAAVNVVVPGLVLASLRGGHRWGDRVDHGLHGDGHRVGVRREPRRGRIRVPAVADARRVARGANGRRRPAEPGARRRAEMAREDAGSRGEVREGRRRRRSERRGGGRRVVLDAKRGAKTRNISARERFQRRKPRHVALGLGIGLGRRRAFVPERGPVRPRDARGGVAVQPAATQPERRGRRQRGRNRQARLERARRATMTRIRAF